LRPCSKPPRAVAHLKVPLSVIYRLADDLDHGDLSEDDLQAVVKDLDKASKAAEKPLSVADANAVIDLTKLRIKFGDYH
jgi:hypothetical protein